MPIKTGALPHRVPVCQLLKAQNCLSRPKGTIQEMPGAHVPMPAPCGAEHSRKIGILLRKQACRLISFGFVHFRPTPSNSVKFLKFSQQRPDTDEVHNVTMEDRPLAEGAMGYCCLPGLCAQGFNSVARIDDYLITSFSVKWRQRCSCSVEDMLAYHLPIR